MFKKKKKKQKGHYALLNTITDRSNWTLFFVFAEDISVVIEKKATLWFRGWGMQMASAWLHFVP